ncbi:single-stranded DNA-binding protein [Tolypothrix sp. PCC 7910]|uniref:single-stranded DNA-binding protein n=1 Tax=Tolypothrix sp. PCC 7910 TaxID=2099387 RepID=UPI00142785D0|nr:single-stranded DNA-binding protein [Tolypothrix sp. PCC 7910]QIR39388.1 single-stranded DNA-binding protein [Tolypothrix sp. PCC 7910]
MNSCVLMAEIIQEPQLRYTSDNLAVTEMLVQFPNSQRPEDAPATLKVVGWGNLASEIQQNYHQGDRVIVVGRLGMNTIDRPEGFKEKRAELTVQQIQNVGASFNFSSPPVVTETYSPPAAAPVAATPQPAASYDSPRPTPAPATSTASVAPKVKNPEPIPQPANFERTTYPAAEEPNIDDIPF